jgi:excisionase family DNA binding protein
MATQQISGGRPGSPWLSVEDLAARLNLSPATVRKLRADRKAPLGIRMGKRVRFHIDDVIAWERDRRQASA